MKTPWDIDKLQISHIGLDKISAASRKNRPVSLPAALDISIFKIIFKTLFSEVLFKQKSFAIVKLK